MDHAEIAQMVRANLEFVQKNRTAEKELGISFVQYHLLKTVLERPGVSSHGLARLIGAHPSTLTQSIRRLLKKEALFVASHPKDSRKNVISLTRVGFRLIQEFEAGIAQLGNGSTEPLSTRKRL